MTDELIGKQFGGYEIIEVLGRGGMATVYKAHQHSMNRIVALKVLPRQFLNDDTYMQRFEREVQIVSQLEHRSIVPVHDYGEQDGQPYIVMRYMAGGSVDALIRRGPLPMEKILEILDQIAPALNYAHSKQVLHRDLKPSNVLMDETGGAFLTDFGIARILGESASGTITTQGVVGTPAYMSPEQAQGKPLDGRSDLYSLGVMLFEMATGRQPFEGDTPYSIAVQQVTAPPPMPRSINMNLTVPVETVILTAMNKDREKRYADAVTLVEAVRRAVNPPAQGLHDTQPGMARPEYAPPPPEAPIEAQIPAPPVSSYASIPPAPSSPQQTGPDFTGSHSVGLPSAVRLGRVRRREGRGNWMMSALIGSGIGCAVLLLLILVGVLIVSQIAQQDRDVGLTATAGASTNQPGTLTAVASANPLLGSVPILEGIEGQGTVVASQVTGTPTSTPTPVEDGFIDVGVREPTQSPPVEADARGVIVYASERDGNTDLYLRDLTTQDETRLTTSPAVDTQPAISPDGEWVAFASDRDGDFEIYVISIDGVVLSRITENSVTDRAPTWTSDGEWIAFSSDVRGDGSHDLYRARSDGTELTMLYSSPLRSTDPHFTTDDRFLLFTSGQQNQPSTWEIRRLDMISGAIVTLTNNRVKDWSPVFTGDGGVLYLTEGNGYASIALITGAGAIRPIYDGVGYESGAVLSPDGRFVVFASDVTGRDELYLLSLSGDAQPAPLTLEGGLFPDWWSPNT